MCFAEVKLRILGFQWWIRQKDHFAGVNVSFCKDARPWLGRHNVSWPLGSQERLSFPNVLAKKRNHTPNQMQILQPCWVGRDLLTYGSFSAAVQSFLPPIWRRLGLEGTSPCGRFAVLIGCERRLGRELWSRFGNCCGSGLQKALWRLGHQPAGITLGITPPIH